MLHVPTVDLDAVRTSELWPPIVADAPASLGDLRAVHGVLAGQAHEGMTTAPEQYAESTLRFLLSSEIDTMRVCEQPTSAQF